MPHLSTGILLVTWTFANFALAAGIVSIGALLQAASGLGGGLIIVPLLSILISTDLVPGPIIFASLALSVTMTLRGRSHIDYTMMGQLFTGIIVGTIVAAWFIANVPADSLGLGDAD